MTRTTMIMLSVAGTASLLGMGLLATAADAQPRRGGAGFGPGGPPALGGDQDRPGPRGEHGPGFGARFGFEGFGPDGPGHRGGPPPIAYLTVADVDNSGTLDDDELAMVADRYAAWHANFLQPLLDEFDDDGDGELTGEERRSAARAVAEQRRERMEQRRDRFIEEFDTDGSGDLSDEERQNARETLRARAEERRAELIELFDEDGDGELTGDERLAARDYRREQRRQRLLDINEDGVVNADDVTAIIPLIEAGDPRADLNRDGAVDELDLQVLTDEIAAN